jgi:hypothetical protein
VAAVALREWVKHRDEGNRAALSDRLAALIVVILAVEKSASGG